MFKNFTWFAFLALGAIGAFAIWPVVQSGKLEADHSGLEQSYAITVGSYLRQNFSTVAVCHVIFVFIFAFLAGKKRQLAPQAGSELVKLTGYLYTLAGMVLLLFAHAAMNNGKPTAPQELLRQMLPYLGSGLFSSLLGWFLAAFLDVPALDKAIRYHIAPSSDTSQAGGSMLPPDLHQELRNELAAFRMIVTDSGKTVATASTDLEKTHTFITKASELLGEVQRFFIADPGDRKRFEDELGKVTKTLEEIKAQLAKAG